MTNEEDTFLMETFTSNNKTMIYLYNLKRVNYEQTKQFKPIYARN